MSRFIAVDWSGDATISGQQRKIWVAGADGNDIWLEDKRIRKEVCSLLVEEKRKVSSLFVGLDFAFSYPAWFLRGLKCEDALSFWKIVGTDGEDWLKRRGPHFWGRGKGNCCPPGHREPDWHGFRQTDRSLERKHIQPKSPFQTGGAGAVGTGSIRGIPFLPELQKAGFSIWPFDKPGAHTVIEIYPRAFYDDDLRKSDLERRRKYLERPEFSNIPPSVRQDAVCSDDAFDALVSVLGMQRSAAELERLTTTTDSQIRLEGQIWKPNGS